MRLLKFFDFIFESKSQIKVPFVSSNKFLDLIGKINSPIADEIFKIQYMPSDLSLIRLGESDEMISFTSALKISELLNTDDDRQLSTLVRPLNNETEIYFKQSTDVRVGRFIRKIFGSKFSDKQVEDFVNQFKSQRESNKLYFDLRSGYDIIDAYKSTNYSYHGGSTNPLMNSCMNDEIRLVEFYRYLPVKMLVLINSEGMIFGRALIWSTDRGQFMDRIYTIDDSDYYKFINYAKSNSIIYKSKNKSGNTVPYIKSGQESWFKMSVKLKFIIGEYQMDSYSDRPQNIPYMDTFIYGYGDVLSNFEPQDVDSFYVLQDTDGEVLEVLVKYDIYGQRIEMQDFDDYVFSETQDGYIYYKDAKWLDSEKDYFSFDYLDNPKNGFEYKEDLKTYVRISN